MGNLPAGVVLSHYKNRYQSVGGPETLENVSSERRVVRIIEKRKLRASFSSSRRLSKPSKPSRAKHGWVLSHYENLYQSVGSLESSKNVSSERLVAKNVEKNVSSERRFRLPEKLSKPSKPSRGKHGWVLSYYENRYQSVGSPESSKIVSSERPVAKRRKM